MLQSSWRKKYFFENTIAHVCVVFARRKFNFKSYLTSSWNDYYPAPNLFSVCFLWNLTYRVLFSKHSQALFEFRKYVLSCSITKTLKWISHALAKWPKTTKSQISSRISNLFGCISTLGVRIVTWQAPDAATKRWPCTTRNWTRRTSTILWTFENQMNHSNFGRKFESFV